MAGFFDETYYLKHKADQLAKSGINDADGKPYTADTLKSALADLGLSPEDHYKAYGSGEKLNPNPYFNEVEYLAAKKALLAETDPSWATKTVDQLRDELKATGLTAAEHYEKYGAFEANSKGVLLNPSNAFDANAYFAAKLVELKSAGVEGADTMTVAQVVEFFKESGMSPVTHYEAHGATEATQTQTPLVQTVPSEQRVPNDSARTENVPGNYNPPTVGATSPDAAPAPVAKPADMGGKVPAEVSPIVTPPTKPLPVPGDSGYKAPPTGLVDTNEKPVVPPSDATNGNWAQVDPDTGAADLIKPDGTPGGTLPPGSFDPSKPIDPSVPPTPSTPENPGGGGGGTTPAELTVTYDNNDDPTKATLSLNKASEVTVTIDGSGDYILTPKDGAAYPLDSQFKTGNFEITKDVTLVGTHDVFNVSGSATSVLSGAGSVKITDGALSKNITINASSMTGAVTAAFTEGSALHTLTYSGGSGVDNVSLTAENATGGDYSNMQLTANLGAGDDVITVALGKAGISFAAGSTLNGGDGTDTLKITGTAPADGVLAFSNDNMLQNIEKIDLTAFNANGHTVGVDLTGQTEGFEVIGTSGKNNITGGAGNDILRGGAADDTLNGGAGDDYIAGGDGADTIKGGDGADWIKGGAGNDTIYAGVSASDSTSTGTMNQFAAESLGGASKTLIWDIVKEDASGGTITAGDFWMTKNARIVINEANIVEGGAGDDTMYASNGKDVFLYQVGGVDRFGNDRGFNGTTNSGDIINGFSVTDDKLMIMDQDAWNNTAASAVTNGQRGFSTLWEFGGAGNATNGTLTINGAGASGNNAGLKWGYGIGADNSNNDVYVQFIDDNSDGTSNQHIITIKSSVLALTPNPDETITIKLVGLADDALNTQAEIATIFGATANS